MAFLDNSLKVFDSTNVAVVMMFIYHLRMQPAFLRDSLLEILDLISVALTVWKHSRRDSIRP